MSTHPYRIANAAGVVLQHETPRDFVSNTAARWRRQPQSMGARTVFHRSILGALLVSLASTGCAARSMDRALANARAVENAPAAENARSDDGAGDTGSTFVILTDRPPGHVAPLADVRALASKLGEAQCGDDVTCRAVRAFATSHCQVRVMAASESGLTREDIGELADNFSDADRARAVASERAISVVCVGAARPAQLTARASFALAAYVAERTDGAVYDLQVQRLDAASVFARRAIVAPLDAASFNPSAHLVVHRVQVSSGGVALKTRGLARFGVPDIETTTVPPSTAAPLSRILTTVAVQLVSRGASASVHVTLDDVARVSHQPVASLFIGEGAPAPVTFALTQTTLKSVRLVPPGGTGPEDYVAAVCAIFGSEDSVAYIKHDAELLAASNRAKARLADVLTRFARDRGRGAQLRVKLPFDVPGQKGSHEWMWIEVASWTDKTIRGYLENEPETIPELRAGMSVTGERKDIFDYLVRWPDGREEGGETSAILRRRAGQ